MFLRRNLIFLSKKLSTDLAGVDVIPNAREVLISIYKKTIEMINDYGLEGKEWNKTVLNLTKHRLEVTEQFTDIFDIERELQAGQIEEIVEQAEDEMELLIDINEKYKPWELDPSVENEFKNDLYSTFEEESKRSIVITRDEALATDVAAKVAAIDEEAIDQAIKEWNSYEKKTITLSNDTRKIR